MLHLRQIGSACFALIGILLPNLLSSCTVVDAFSARAVDYNLQAESAQNRVLLLNVIRASLKRGMQFTTLQSVTGSTQGSIGPQFYYPFRQPPFSQPPSLTLPASISGGPTFTVPVLDTQEFYRGILEPLTGREYDYFISEGYPPALIFYLFVGKIDLTVLSGSKAGLTLSFPNYVGDDYDLELFEAIADHLLNLGFTVERVSRVLPFGPPLPLTKAANLKALVAADAAGLDIVAVPPVATAAAKHKRAAGAKGARTPAGRQYQIVKGEAFYRFCFNPRGRKGKRLAPALLCANARTASPPGKGKPPASTALTGVLSAGLGQRLKAVSKAFRAHGRGFRPLPAIPAGATVRFRFTMRSTEGIIHYLGSVVRRQLYPRFGRPRSVEIKVGMPYLTYPQTPCTGAGKQVGFGYRCENLLEVETGAPPPKAPLAVAYEGRNFWIPGTPRHAGWSLRVLDLVKQLLALHTNAKELPASTVLSIVAPP